MTEAGLDGQLPSFARPAAPALYGREAELRAVLESTAPVLLLTGDSGIGKSELLRAVQEATTPGTAPPPITLAQPRGSLQRSFLQGLADATAELARDRGRASQVADRLATAGKKLVDDKGIALAKVVAQAVLLKLKEQVGADAVDVVTEYLRDLSVTGQETLLNRLLAAADPSLTDALVAFAAEVVDLAGEHAPVVVALDGGELLQADDRVLLGDLAGRMPSGLQLRVGFGTWSEKHRAHVEDLRVAASAIQELELQGIGLDGIRAWLVAREVDAGRTEEVFALTKGYPLWVVEEVAELAAGGEGGGVDPQQQFRNRTQLAWRDLDPQAQAVARQLAVFPAPLPEAVLREVCNLSPADWGAAIDRLQRSRILSTIVNGVPWFHPQRQDVVRGLLRESERQMLDAASQKAIHAYLGLVQSADAPELTANIAQLVADSPTILKQGAVRSATELDADQLAIMAALVEIFEPRSHPVDANYVLEHAHEFFSGEGDLLSALAALTEARLILATTHQHGIFLRPAPMDATTTAVVQGRALLELGRLPLPGLASSVFAAVLAPRIQPFVNCVYGFGAGSMRESVQNATRLGMAPSFPGVGGRGQGHFLIVRMRFHGRPMSATIRFQTSEYLEAARNQLDGLQLDVLGGGVEVEQALAHPEGAVAAGRFIRVVERALGCQLNPVTLELGMKSPCTVDEYIRQRVETFSFVHNRCSQAERRAYGLETAPSVHWHLDARFQTLDYGEVYGGAARAVRHDNVPLVTFADPYAIFRYARAFGLREGERLRHLTHRGRGHLPTDPVVDAIRDLRSRAIQVTRHQRQVRIAVDIGHLQTRILEARRRQLADARELAACVTLDGKRVEPSARTLFVSIYELSQPVVGRLGFRSLELVKDDGKEEVHVSDRHVPDGGPTEAVEDFRKVFGFKGVGESYIASTAGATTGIASLLGYEDGDILLVDAEGRPADAF